MAECSALYFNGDSADTWGIEKYYYTLGEIQEAFMCMLVDKMKRLVGLCALSLLLSLTCMVLGDNIGDTKVVFASEMQTETEEGTAIEDTQVVEKEEKAEEPPFSTKEKFVFFTCCLFSVAVCVVIGLFGNPNDRLKDKYKRARKQQLLQEKKKKEAEERAAKRAAQDAKYAEELAQYEADVKAYEEAKAAKAAAKAAKKAEKEAKKK